MLFGLGLFFFKQKTAYEIMPSLVGSEMCIRDSFYPCKALLSEFQAAGVPLTVGSDAHHASRIGAHIEDAYQFARSVGYLSLIHI